MRFFLGDDNGQLKSVCCTEQSEAGWKLDVALLDDNGRQGKIRAIQQLAAQGDKVAVARGDGTVTLFAVEGNAKSARVVQDWQEHRFKHGEQYVGLGLTTDSRAISCTQAGHLRMVHLEGGVEDVVGSSSQASLPNRLNDWILSGNSETFIYGGDEVEVSVWDTSRAFDPSRSLPQSSNAGVKRRRAHKLELMDGEIWRAKNVSNDYLNLRQPVHNTSIAYLSSPIGDTGLYHILAGTRLGSVRRYDTRAARKPVADWKGVSRAGGIKEVQGGNFEHDAFIADNENNLFALDLRTGKVLYAYSGLAGTISSLASTSSITSPLLASTSLDRFFRLHSTSDPGLKNTDLPNTKGEVLAKVWLKSAPGCIVWDGCIPNIPLMNGTGDDLREDGDGLWAGMQNIGENDSSPSDSASENDRINKKQKAQ